ncbi:hypothetical protein Tco_1021700, partial [Tanacetum coccineum]
ILVVLEDPATGEPGTESFPPFSADSLALVLRMSDCPSPTLTAQPEGALGFLRGGDDRVGPWIFFPFAAFRSKG